jgi:calcineurin-like phosphoesterase family protein
MYFKPPLINESTVNASVNISNYKSIQQKEIVAKIAAEKRKSVVNRAMNLDLF